MNSLRNILTKSIINAFLLGIIVGFAGYWAILDSGLGKLASSPSDKNTELSKEEMRGNENDNVTMLGNSGDDIEKKKISLVATGENILVVSNQPSGDVVIISMASIESSGWLAVHETGEEGMPGNILGAKRVDTGKHFALKIELLRGTSEGSNYFVVLHADDGDSEFSIDTELPLQDSAGDYITAEFIATSNSESN